MGVEDQSGLKRSTSDGKKGGEGRRKEESKQRQERERESALRKGLHILGHTESYQSRIIHA